MATDTISYLERKKLRQKLALLTGSMVMRDELDEDIAEMYEQLAGPRMQMDNGNALPPAGSMPLLPAASAGFQKGRSNPKVSAAMKARWKKWGGKTRPTDDATPEITTDAIGRHYPKRVYQVRSGSKRESLVTWANAHGGLLDIELFKRDFLKHGHKPVSYAKTTVYSDARKLTERGIFTYLSPTQYTLNETAEPIEIPSEPAKKRGRPRKIEEPTEHEKSVNLLTEQIRAHNKPAEPPPHLKSARYTGPKSKKKVVPIIGFGTNAEYLYEYAAAHGGKLYLPEARAAAAKTRGHENLQVAGRITVAVAEMKRKGFFTHVGTSEYDLTPTAYEVYRQERAQQSR